MINVYCHVFGLPRWNEFTVWWRCITMEDLCFCENISLVHKFDNDHDEILLEGFVETFNSYLDGNWLSMRKMKVM